MDDLDGPAAGPAAGDAPLTSGATTILLHLDVSDPEVVEALRHHAAGAARERFALGAQMQDDGDLARLLKSHLGGDDSVLAKTLAQRLGEGSAIFKRLSPADADGVQAQLKGILFSKRTAPDALQPFARYGRNLAIVWDAEDSASEVIVKAACSVARALVVRDQHDTQETAAAVKAIAEATRSIEKQIKNVEEIEKWSSTIASNGQKIQDTSRKMREALKSDVDRLDAHLAALSTTADVG